MTDAHAALALVSELREIHARSRQNAREQGWGIPPEAEDASPWSRAADMIEAQSAALTDANARIEEAMAIEPGPGNPDWNAARDAFREVLAADAERLLKQRLINGKEPV